MNKSMAIYLTTRGRPNKQFTLAHLPVKWLARTIVVCPAEERKIIERAFPKVGGFLHPKTTNLTEKRAWIVQHTEFERIMLMDDDLRFHVRRKNVERFRGFKPVSHIDWATAKLKDPDVGRLYLPEPKDPKLAHMFDRIEWMLGQYAHGGIGIRYMNQTVGSEFVLNKKVLHALAYNTPVLRDVCKGKLKRLTCGVENDYMFQLMRAGYQNAVYCWGTNEEPEGRAAPGGTSAYRTNTMINECAQILERLHPDFVKVEYNKEQKIDGVYPVTLRVKKAADAGFAEHGRRKP